LLGKRWDFFGFPNLDLVCIGWEGTQGNDDSNGDKEEDEHKIEPDGVKDETDAKELAIDGEKLGNGENQGWVKD
jgi:hypothetical protein